MVPLEFPITPRRSKEEDIYEDLCYVTLRIPEVPTACLCMIIIFMCMAVVNVQMILPNSYCFSRATASAEF